MPTINSTEQSPYHREQDLKGKEYGNIDNIQAENQVEFDERNQHGGSDVYMRDQRTEEATGFIPNIDEYDQNSAVRSNGLGSRQSALPASGGKESLVLGYVRGASEIRSRRLIAQGPHAGSGPRPSEKTQNVSGNTNMQKLPIHVTGDAVAFDHQVPMEKVADARKSHVKTAQANDVSMMTDKSKVSFFICIFQGLLFLKIYVIYCKISKHFISSHVQCLEVLSSLNLFLSKMHHRYKN
ncbi:RNA binding (RRM/RBD/RNP motifs) family protein [Zea mays]|nr:RNA binding (RRM/RBD/RNP motifs) family protein [Zea mays]